MSHLPWGSGAQPLVDNPVPSDMPMISSRQSTSTSDPCMLKDIPTSGVRPMVVLGQIRFERKSTRYCRTIRQLEYRLRHHHRRRSAHVAEGRKLAQLRSDVGMVFQSFNLFAHKTILENITLAPSVRRKSKAEAHNKAMALLERVGVANQADKYTPSCPAGSSSRSRSPVTRDEPQIMLFDKPTVRSIPR